MLHGLWSNSSTCVFALAEKSKQSQITRARFNETHIAKMIGNHAPTISCSHLMAELGVLADR